jgi:hypothetical protein
MVDSANDHITHTILSVHDKEVAAVLLFHQQEIDAMKEAFKNDHAVFRFLGYSAVTIGAALVAVLTAGTFH